MPPVTEPWATGSEHPDRDPGGTPSHGPDRPLLSVVVVTWRARDHVLRCLESLRQHAGVDHEVIVVDDGSGDGTAEAVRAGYPDVRLLAKPVNEGLVAGRNDALPLVRGRLVLMLDSDTEVRPGALERLAAVLDRRPEVGLVGPRLVYPDGRIQLSCRRYPPLVLPFLRRGPYPRFVDDDPTAHRRHMMKDFDHATERSVVWVMGAAQMWRADLPSTIGPYDRRLSSYGGEDQDWCLRVWAAGLQVRYVAGAEVMHVWQAVTRQALYGPKSRRALRDFYYLQWKHRALRRDPRLEDARGAGTRAESEGWHRGSRSLALFSASPLLGNPTQTVQGSAVLRRRPFSSDQPLGVGSETEEQTDARSGWLRQTPTPCGGGGGGGPAQHHHGGRLQHRGPGGARRRRGGHGRRHHVGNVPSQHRPVGCVDVHRGHPLGTGQHQLERG